MPQFADRVKVTSTSTGTGAITLSSSAVSGYQAFPSSLDGETVGYVIESGSEWEIGTGTYTHSSLNLTRSLRSSSTGSLLSLASGTHTVFLTPAYQDIQIVEAFSGTSDLPSASDNHGRIYHVHGEGAMYFAHGGSWYKMANYSDIVTYSNATTSAAGLMSAADKTKLDGVETSADVTDTTNVVAALTAGTNITIAADGTISSSASGGGGGSTASALTEQEFTATAGQTVFTVTGGITNADNVVVFLNGSRLADNDIASISTSAGTVTLAAGATSGDIVTVSEFGAAFGSQYSSTIFTVGTSSEYNTSTKVLTTSYTANRVAVYLNGVKLLVGTDCTATNGSSIDLTNAAPVTGDKIEVVEHGTLAESGSGSGVTTYTAKSGTDGTPSGATYIDNASNPSEGDLAYDLAADQLYIRTTSAWKRVALGVDETPIITTEPATTHTLNSDGSTSTVTMVAEDPEGFDITYGIAYPTASNALPNQLATATSINQSTGVFTFDPSTNTSHAGDVKVRLSASDGARTTTRFCTLTLGFIATVDYLVVAGGGAGGVRHAGGGGAGGLIYSTSQSLNTATTYTITVGTGGAIGTNQNDPGGSGTDSSISGSGFTTVTAIGGGGGAGSDASSPASNGGSGGGGSYPATTPGTGTSGQGYGGGTGQSAPPYHGGGGGGSGAVGGNPTGSVGGAGGAGTSNSITGTALFYAAGGGGGTYNSSSTSSGGSGIGGNGGGGLGSATAPTANTGSGGGGAGGGSGNGTPTAGADGVVIIRTLSSAASTTGSPTVTTDGSYNIYKFTASGTITF